jgi:hypothetical protein
MHSENTTVNPAIMANLVGIFEISYKITTGAISRIAAKIAEIIETTPVIFRESYSTESY